MNIFISVLSQLILFNSCSQRDWQKCFSELAFKSTLFMGHCAVFKSDLTVQKIIDCQSCVCAQHLRRILHERTFGRLTRSCYHRVGDGLDHLDLENIAHELENGNLDARWSPRLPRQWNYQTNERCVDWWPGNRGMCSMSTIKITEKTW